MPHPTSISFLVFDVDGILTDGAIRIDDRGVETKSFSVRDGFAIRAAMRQGLKIGILTGRSSQCVIHRMNELGVAHLMQGSKTKAIGIETLCQQAGVELAEACFMGDDIPDLPAMLRCGYRITVPDAAAEVRAVADFITTSAGGQGAAREAIEHILKAQDKWEQVLEEFGV
jgi:3-deoxy-D-manno-octulosonate 8-phosphate phosphatase (KDO 8-P phosphatase)